MKVTVYFLNMFGYGSFECNLHEMTVKPYAQYPNSVALKFKQPRQKLMRAMCRYDGGLLILKGWGHMKPPSPFDKPVVRQIDGGQVIESATKWASCDPRWSSSFDKVIDAYIAESGAEVFLDVRSVEAMRALPLGVQAFAVEPAKKRAA